MLLSSGNTSIAIASFDYRHIATNAKRNSWSQYFYDGKSKLTAIQNLEIDVIFGIFCPNLLARQGCKYKETIRRLSSISKLKDDILTTTNLSNLSGSNLSILSNLQPQFQIKYNAPPLCIWLIKMVYILLECASTYCAISYLLKGTCISKVTLEKQEVHPTSFTEVSLLCYFIYVSCLCVLFQPLFLNYTHILLPNRLYQTLTFILIHRVSICSVEDAGSIIHRDQSTYK